MPRFAHDICMSPLGHSHPDQRRENAQLVINLHNQRIFPQIIQIVSQFKIIHLWIQNLIFQRTPIN
jgi:hypothetical protein